MKKLCIKGVVYSSGNADELIYEDLLALCTAGNSKLTNIGKILFPAGAGSATNENVELRPIRNYY